MNNFLKLFCSFSYVKTHEHYCFCLGKSINKINLLESVPVSVVCVAGGQYDLHAAYGQLKAEETARVVGEPWLHVDTNIIKPRHVVDRSASAPPPPSSLRRPALVHN